MKKYFITFLIALIIGFFLCFIFLNQYDDFKGIKVSNTSEKLYFIQYGVFSSLESLEKNTINLQNYVYNEKDNLYYVYVGITSDYENAKIIVNYYKNKGYDTLIKEFYVSNKSFVQILKNYDSVLSNTSDDVVITSIMSQVLSKYGEVVNNGS